ncbi:MAG: BACON domain-containing protein [Prevotellaceae bacterium]|jgi:hypothetical protein|nr:BACON domain-containing protein [Prevotellaceae bacterium]
MKLLKYLFPVIAVVIFSCKEDEVQDIPFLKLQVAADSVWTVAREGGEKEFCIETNRALTSEQPDWLAVSSELHSETTHITVTASANDTHGERTATIRFSVVPIIVSEAKISIEVRVRQAAHGDDNGEGEDEGAHHH